MNLRELQQQNRAVVVDTIVKESRPGGCVSPSWLACYPTFHDALQHGETSFRALPHYAKLPALKRAATNTEARAVTSTILNEVRAAYVELSTACVVEAVEGYLSAGNHIDRSHGLRSTSVLDAIAAEFPPTSAPLIARQPCLLSPGKSIFLDGWVRFFAYWSRNDKTIPLLAVDWSTLYERLSQSSALPDRNQVTPKRERAGATGAASGEAAQ
jgi:hypothetical protein